MTLALLGYPVLLIAFALLVRSQRRREDALLNRIQAPERTVSRALAEAAPQREHPLYVSPDDDNAWWHATEERIAP